MFRKIIEWLVVKYNEVFFVGATDKLPPPLSKEDELKYLIRAKAGDEEARNILIEHNLRLVVFLAKKYENTTYDIEDLVSIGSIGLIKGINTYKIDKNIKLATYASRCISNEILMFLRKLKKDQKADSIDKIITYDKEGKKVKIEDTISDETDIAEDYEKIITYKIIREIVEELPDQEKEIIKLYFGFYNNEIHTQKEIADMMSISQSNISKSITKIVKKIGSQLKNLGVTETTGRTNKDTIKVNKSTLPMSTVTPTMGIQTQKNIESSEISIETSPSLTLKKDK